MNYWSSQNSGGRPMTCPCDRQIVSFIVPSRTIRNLAHCAPPGEGDSPLPTPQQERELSQKISQVNQHLSTQSRPFATIVSTASAFSPILFLANKDRQGGRERSKKTKQSFDSLFSFSDKGRDQPNRQTVFELSAWKNDPGHHRAPDFDHPNFADRPDPGRASDFGIARRFVHRHFRPAFRRPCLSNFPD